MRHVALNPLMKTNTLLFIAILLFLGGCTTVPQGPKRRLFFPPPPVEPKIEWKAAYQDQHSFPKSRGAQRIDALLGKAPSVGFTRPMDVASNGKGLIYVTDPDSRNVYIYDTVNYTVDVLDRGGEGVFTLPLGIAVGVDGRIYVADRFKKKVLVFGPDTKPLFSIGGLEAPVGVAVDNINKKIYVSDVKTNTVNVYDNGGGLLYILGGDKDVRMNFNFPVDVDVLPNGQVVVVDTMNARIHIIDSEGNYIRRFGKRGDTIDSFDLIKAVAADQEGHIYISDVGSNTIKVYTAEGKLLLSFGGTFNSPSSIAPAGFSMIAGISSDSKNGIYVADQMSMSIQVFQYLDEEYLKLNPLPDSYRFIEEGINETK